MSETESTSDQDDVSFIRTDDMVCLQCSETGERVCLAAEGFGNRHCFLESIANRNYPPEMPSCVFVIEQALSVRALQEMVTAESGDSKQMTSATNETGEGSVDSGIEQDAPSSSSPGSESTHSGSQTSTNESSGVGGGNRTLLYGHAVLLRHLHSGMYLATLSTCSSSDKLAFDVGLKDTKEIGESCWWTVHPGSKQRSEGEKVRFGDDLILVSVATERYLHYTTSDTPVLPLPMSSATAAATADCGLNSIGRQAIVNASFHSTHWSIAPFGTGLSRLRNVGYVFGGQVLRLLHGGDECLTISASTTSLGEPMSQEPQGVQGQSSGTSAWQSNQSQNIQSQQPSQMSSNKQQVEVIYEGGAVMNQARSLWRLDLIRTKWSGGFVQYSNALRIRHITTGKYLGVCNSQLCLLPKVEATVERTAFCLRLTKDDSKGSKTGDGGDDKDEEVIGSPMIKYGDTSLFIQHIESQRWLSYKSYETKKRGVGRVEEKQAILSAEGKMDDCLEFSRSQEEEAKTARVIRKCDALFSKFIKILDNVQMIASLQKHRNSQQQSRMSFAATGDEIGDLQSRLNRRRPSIAASSVAAAAMAASVNSSLAPLFLSEHSEIPQAVGGENFSGSSSPKKVDFNLSTILQEANLFPHESQVEMSKCLEDLIDYFAPPEEGCDHEQEQSRLRALRNRQDLFQEEGILNLILDAIDKINLISGRGLLVLLLGAENSSTWEAITGYFYQLLAAIIKDNHTNCAQFAQSHRLNWLFSRLSGQQASEGTGMLDVLHCVLVDSPEALNMLRESHIKVLISLLEKHGRDPKVLNVLCSLCVSNGVAIRSSQNTITNHLLPGRNLLLQTRLVDNVASMKPNLYVARVDGSAMYKRWYYEVIVDHIELINGLSPHFRVGWANSKGYMPYPGSGSHWGANGVGDDFYSYGFDGQYLWAAGRPTLVRIPPNSTMTRQEVLTNQMVDYQNQQQALLDSYAIQQRELVASQSDSNQQHSMNAPRQSSDGLTSMSNIDPFTHSPYLRLQKNDVIGCLIDLSVPSIQFTINGKQIFGFFKNFNVLNGGLFHPVVSFSAKVSCRFLFGSNHGELRFRPPAGFSPLVDVLLPNQEISVEPCFSFGDLAKQVLSGPQLTPDSVPQLVTDMIFIPQVIDTQNIELSTSLEPLRDNLAENMHELWCMSRIEDGWIYGDEHSDEDRSHPYIAPYSMLPALGKKYKVDLATQTLKTIIGIGYKISPPRSNNQNQGSSGPRVKTYRLPNVPYMQSNGYKPAPLDLSNIEMTPAMNRLVELLAENIHNIWAAEKINLKWTYRRRDPMSELMEDFPQDGRSCHLLPYKYVDSDIKLKNRQSALETVFTILAYGYNIEPTSIASLNSGTQNSLAIHDSLGDIVGSPEPNTPQSPPVIGNHSPVMLGARPTTSRPASIVGSPQAMMGSSSPQQQQTQSQVESGHDVILNNAMQVGKRHFRAERTYAVRSGRWYYEVEVQTLGHIQIGWANVNFRSDSQFLGCDENSWAFDCNSGRKVHNSSYESFGQIASISNVIGCMLDLNDRTISYSLNGKLMLDSLGNEMAFGLSDQQVFYSSYDGSTVANGFVPAISLGPNERVRLCFGQDVEQLRYFTDYGLQEGYQPFCVNMHRPTTLWYNRREPNFLSIDEIDPNQVNIEVTRIPPGSDSPPALKIAYKQFESQERATWEYIRLSLPVTINNELLDETDKIAKMQEIQAQQLRIAYSQMSRDGSSRDFLRGGKFISDSDPNSASLRHPARLEQHMLQSGFSIADVKNLQRSYESQNETSHHTSFHLPNVVSGLNRYQNQNSQGQQRRFHLTKTRSVDTDNTDRSGQVPGPSLAVPSFNEAQRMMTATGDHQQPGSLLNRRSNKTLAPLSKSSSSSLENLSQTENTQPSGFNKTSRSRSTFKSLLGSMKGNRTQSLSRQRAQQGIGSDSNLQQSGSGQLPVPKISIQGNNAQDELHSTTRQASLSQLNRSGSEINVATKQSGSNEPPSSGTGRGSGLVRRLSRVGLSVSGTSGRSGTQEQTSSAEVAQDLTSSDAPPPFDLQQLDQATLELVDEYYYGVRIFPGQEPSHVLCGWVTGQFKHESLVTLQDIQYTQIIQSTSLVTGQAEICDRRECYLLNAGQLYKEMYPSTTNTATAQPTGTPNDPNAHSSGDSSVAAASSRSANRGMLIGCHVDTSTGILSFTVGGKPTKYKFQLEPQTKLYPGIFFQATTGDCLQFELSRTPLTLPLSSAILNLTPKHVSPQCPQRLKVQTLQTSYWSRVPNISVRPNSLKLSESRGWSMLADDPLAMLLVHIPEDDKCLDVLELIEHERLLKFHSNTLTLYGALCAQGNHKVAHIICSHVDQRQILYAINSDYLSGDLRLGFADLLIALHLEFHAYGRHLTQNEFIVPITRELYQLYGDVSTNESTLSHSFSRIECVSIRTEMKMSPIGFDLNSMDSNEAANIVKLLSTPYFPINILKKLVFQALDEAVVKGNLPIRDLPGGNSANLFVPLLQLADKLLLVGCIKNHELAWLLNLIDPDTFERPKLNQGIDMICERPSFAGLSFLAQGSNTPSSIWKPTILEQPSVPSSKSKWNSRGLLQMPNLDEKVKLAICHILHHLIDIQLRHRIESIMAFSVNFVGQLQTDQHRRYNEIKNSDLPSHLTARKTREFRCTPREQMRYILNFKSSLDTDDPNASPSSEPLRNTLKNMHSSMMKQIKIIIESSGSHSNHSEDLDLNNSRRYSETQSDNDSSSSITSSMSKLMRVLQLVKMTLLSPDSRLEAHLRQQNAQLEGMFGNCGLSNQTELKFIKDIVKTVVKWAEESTIESKQLIRQMFHLLLRCYNGVGELIEALNNSYVVGEKSKNDVIDLLQVLSKVRALLAVQMGPAEEEVMRDCLWTLVNNVVFFQHPDLIRILRVHENVMHVMMNTLNKRSRAVQKASSSMSSATTSNIQDSSQSGQGQIQRSRTQSIQGGNITNQVSDISGQQILESSNEDARQNEDISKMVVSCCRFLCFFCRSSAKNQKAMFEHLGFILENSNILLSRPSLRGSTPLDVACSSLMENHELVLALRESYLEKIAIYLSRCGLQANQELLDKGYPDVGWDPVEGERYLDFLRFCVWVNGESVEENSNLVIRLLIRRPECLGPALRGEGPGLFAAIKDAISMADSIHTDQLSERHEMQLDQDSRVKQEEHQQQQGGDNEDEENEDEINMGSAILNFYCALVDLLGRCAPDLQTIGQGRHESIRALSILKSLVPLQDLRNAISLRFNLVDPQWLTVNENEQPFATTASSFMPNHKQSLVLFLERVYGIEDQATFFSLLEEAFLPDMRAATMLERPAPLSSNANELAQNQNQSFGLQMSSGGGTQQDSSDGSGDDEDSDNEITLALNRYLGNSAIPLLIRESHYFKNAEDYANLLEPTLHTVYRLSKVKILTKGQRESVSDFLIALTREMQPHQLLKLLRKLTVDVAVLNESTTVALRLLTLHYERCSKYYGYSSGTGGGSNVTGGSSAQATFGSSTSSSSIAAGTATEEERRLTMVLFTNIFDSLSLMDYDPELFENALPCLNALACALPPDYSLTEARDSTTGGAKLVGRSQNAGSSRLTSRILSSGRGTTGLSGDEHQQLASQQANIGVGPYVPQPVDTHHIESLDLDLRQLARRFSEHYHDAWASRKLDRDWQYGEQYNFKNKIHPRLKPYSLLTQFERDRYIEPIEEAMKALIAMGWTISRLDAHGLASRPGSRSDFTLTRQDSTTNLNAYNPNQRMELIQSYNPQPVDTSNLSLSRELQNLAERSAENAHDLWAKKQMEDWAIKLRASANDPLRSPIMLHPLMVPYDLLTDKEKRKNRDRSQELLKYMLFEGYKVYRTDEVGAQSTSLISRGRINSRADANQLTDLSSRPASGSNDRRFAYSILDKLLAYCDTVMVKLELLKPSANFSRRSSFKQSDRDVKFFSKVVLPLIERYFTAHRDFFLSNYGLQSVTGSNNEAELVGDGHGERGVQSDSGKEASTSPMMLSGGGVVVSGCATIREKEMLVTLFCKLASILRNKLPVIGPDAKIFVRCLQVLTRAFDARSLSEQSIDFVRSSMLTFFNKTAQDLSQCVFNLRMKRYNAIRGTTMRTSSSLYHIHLSVLPTLTALFDHLASSESGKYLLMDEIQVACHKILLNLYLLGTQIQLAKNHEFSRKELERHRHSYGNCLAAFAAAFPIAFLESQLNRFNRFSVINTKRHQPLGTKQRQQPTSDAQSSTQLLNVAKEAKRPSDQQAGQQKQQNIQQNLDSQLNLPKLDELLQVTSKFVQNTENWHRENANGSGGSMGGHQVGSHLENSVNVSGPSPASSNNQGSIVVSSHVSGGAHSSADNSITSGVSNVSGASTRSRGQDHQGSTMRPTDNDSSIIEVIVPLLCSYLPFWYSQGQEGPAITRQTGAGAGSTEVVSKHLNNLLGDIMNLIRSQLGIDQGVSSQWLVTIAAHASQIIIDETNDSSDLLKKSFLPLSTKLTQRAENIYHREEMMRGYLKSSAEDTTAIEEKIQEEFHVLVRDIYAFYPLLIKYADYKKSIWLKQSQSQSKQQNLSYMDVPNSTNSLNGHRQQESVKPDQEMGEQSLNEQQSRPEHMLFHQVATVFDIWSNSQYFRREEQNFISQHEIDNMALIMQASNRPGRTFFQKSDTDTGSTSGRKKNKRRPGNKRDREREVASSLLVVALKRLLPIGMNLFGGRERELVQLVKERFLKKESSSKIEELVRIQLTQPNKIDPSDEFCWQHYLYSRLGANNQAPKLQNGLSLDAMTQEHPLQVQHGTPTPLDASTVGSRVVVDNRIVGRIIDMARVFYGLHIIDHPNLQQKIGRRSCVSTQRRRVVIACFRMTSLHSLPRHRAINIFLRSYCDTWLLDENFGQEKLIEDLTQTFEQAEMTIGQAGEAQVPRNDPLSQLIMTLSRQATTEHVNASEGGMDASGVDRLYLHFTDIFRMSCGGDEEEEEEDEEANSGGQPDESAGCSPSDGTNEDDNGNGDGDENIAGDGQDGETSNEDDGSAGGTSIHEQEMEKQRLLFQQSRLSIRGVAEMILLYISAYSRYQTPGGSGSGSAAGSSGGGSAVGSMSKSHQTSMILKTLKLGISILRGGNVDVQRRMLKHLKDRKDVGFFTSIQSLMNSCSVLNLDAFERNQKAEALGVRSEGTASEKNMYDAEFTCKLFRFFQLLCEGHNLEFQNYLRTQAGNTTTVNVVISTVDYLLRLQESIMDFYWHYSSKDVIDPSGTENFIKAFKIAKQVFSTLTESIQGPCPQNQQALAHSRLWHAVGGFLFLFAHMQDKLSRNSSQLGLLIELLDLQKEMVIMMLSMLEGNVVNGTIGKQMVETLVESSGNVELILKFFDMFLKLPRLTSATNFQEYDKTGSGWISQNDLKKVMEQQKIYTQDEIHYLLSCCEPNHDGLIDYREFIDRFHQPAKDIGFNLAVLLTNLTEHITNEPRLQRFLDSASSVLKYFEPYLGRIEIMGSSNRIERVYFEIKESTLDQWAKPQIQESKRAFFFSIVTECDGKEKLEAFVNFCEDTIFEMQHATKILGESEQEPPTKADKYPFDATGSSTDSNSADTNDFTLSRGNVAPKVSASLWWRLISDGFLYVWLFILLIVNQLKPARMRRRYAILRHMSYGQIAFAAFRFLFGATWGTVKFLFTSIGSILKFIFKIMVDDGSLVNKEQQQHPSRADKRHKVTAGKHQPRVQHLTGEAYQDDGSMMTSDEQTYPTRDELGFPIARSEIVTGPTIYTARVADVTQTKENHSMGSQAEQRKISNEGGEDPLISQASELANNLGLTKDQSFDIKQMESNDQTFLLHDLIDGGDIGPSGRIGHKSRKHQGLGTKLAQLANYKEKVVSFLARNFYTIKLLALVTAFIINFILLFFKVSIWTAEADEALAAMARGQSSLGDRGEIDQNGRRLGRDLLYHDTDDDDDDKFKPLPFARRLGNIEDRLERSISNYEARYKDPSERDEEEKQKEDDDDDEIDEKEIEDEDSGDDDEEDESEDEEEEKSQQEKVKKKKKNKTDDAEDDDPKDVVEGNDDEDDDDDDDDDEEESTELSEYVIMDENYYYFQSILTVLASVHSLFSFCMLVAYYHLKVPLVIFKREKEIARKLEFDGIYIVEDQDGEENRWTQWQAAWDKLVISAESFPVNYWDKFVKKRVREKYREQYGYEAISDLLGMENASNKQNDSSLGTSWFSLVSLGDRISKLFNLDFRYQIWKAGITLTDQSFLYQLFYLVFSLAGHYNYFFFAAHLLDVAFGFKKLRTILHSVTHNGQQLVLTVMLLTIVVYIYTVIAFNFFRKFYVQGEDNPDRKCHSMMTCFVYHFYQGVRAGGGIGDVIEAPDGDDYEFFRIAFDISFFFSVIVILLAIIQGLIIDAFGELRGQLLAVAEDMESNCFICGIGKDALDKIPRGFETHVQKEHNLANYMFFLMHLINKPNTDYTGQETYVWELYEKRCWNFFPVGECFRTQWEEEGADTKGAKD